MLRAWLRRLRRKLLGETLAKGSGSIRLRLERLENREVLASSASGFPVQLPDAGQGLYNLQVGQQVAAYAAQVLPSGSAYYALGCGNYSHLYANAAFQATRLQAGADWYLAYQYGVAAEYYAYVDYTTTGNVYSLYAATYEYYGQTLAYLNAASSNQPTPTPAPSPTALVTSPTATAITATSATLSGSVTGNGGDVISKRGIVYAPTATNNNPQIGGNGTTEVDDPSGGTGPFAESVSGLTAGTDYSFTAFAIDSLGTIYSSVSTFTTSTPAPTPTPTPTPIPTPTPAPTPAPDFVTMNLAAGSAGQSYSQSISATGGTGSLAFAVSAGSLPTGLALASNGVLAGIPSAIGDFSFHVKVTDSVGASSDHAYSLSIDSGSPLDQFTAAGTLTLAGVDPHAFNSIVAPLQFQLSQNQFNQDPGTVSVTVNGNVVPANQLTISASTITASSALVDGKNVVALTAEDTVGRPVYLTQTVWAGSQSLTVKLVDQNGQAVTDSASVVAKLADDQSVVSQATTSTGQVVFSNVPNRTILVQASASNNRFGVVGATGNAGTVQVTLAGVGTPSSIDNNDIGQGTAGWTVGAAPVTVVSHTEGIPNQAPPISSAPVQSPAVNQDLVLQTSGEGEQSMSRTFTTQPGTTSVLVRYRFITSEVPGGYFGTQYNDYYRVSIQSGNGGVISDANSMNGLGLAAFDFDSGATQWKEIKLAVDPKGDTVQVDAAVANVGDAAYQSQVVVDYIEEEKAQITPTLTWDNVNGGLNLTYTVQGGNVAQDTPINVYWASGQDTGSVLSQTPVFTYTVPAGTQAGGTVQGPIHIPGSALNNAPAGTAYLLAVASPQDFTALPDVEVDFGQFANPATVEDTTMNALKDLLRQAGQSSATITSTARTPADQARAMFQNLTNPAHSIATNIATQLAIYAAPGDAVINVFANMVEGLTLQQVLANQTAIRNAMVTEINNQGPSNVSHHCADPDTLAVVDIYAPDFSASNGSLFVSAATGDSRVSRFIDERSTNSCYHLELPQ